MKNAISVGIVHPHLSIEELSLFIDSYNNQTLKDIELLLFVDSNISFYAQEILKNIEAPLKIIHEKFIPIGMGYHLNSLTFLLNDEIEFVFRVDLDDILLPSRFQYQIEYMKNNPDIDIMSGSYKEITSNDIFTPPLKHTQILKYLMLCPIVHPAVCLRWKSIKRIGGYKSLARNQDLELWLRSAQNGLKFANTREILILYKRNKKHKSMEAILRILKIQSSYYKKLGYTNIGFLKISFIFLSKEIVPIFLKNILRYYFSYFINKDFYFAKK